MPREFDTASDIINQVAGEVGIAPVTDPYSSPNQVFQQLKILINSAGRELLRYAAISGGWEELTKQHEIVTAPGDTGDYPLPDDFGYMIDQTGWERTERVPLGGPLSAQDWQYLLGRDFSQSTIYVSFRIQQGKFRLFPQPPPQGLNVVFEYVSRNWVQSATDPMVYTSKVNNGADKILYEPILMVKFLKAKYLEAKGFDSTSARNEFMLEFDSISGLEKGAPILNMVRSGAFPYLWPYRNTPDSGYGW